MMRVIDRLILLLTRQSRQRKREREARLQEALPGLEGYYLPEIPGEAHTTAHGGLTAASRGLPASRGRSIKMAVATIVVAGGIGLPAYMVGGSIAAAGATEEAKWKAHDAAFVELDVALNREAAALDAAVAAYSAEREAAGASLPEDFASEQIREKRPELSAAEVAEEVDGGFPLMPSYTEQAATDMWVTEPPRTEEARERIQAYKEAETAADKEKMDYEMAQDDLR